MQQTFTLQGKIRQLLVILIPILITQISVCAMNFFDTTMSGHASPTDLAGVAVGANIWMPIFTGINGILIAVTPIIAQHNGAGRREAIPFTVLQGLYLAVAIAAIVLICGALLVPLLLSSMHLEPAVQIIATRFLQAISLGVLPFFMFTILRSFIDTLGYTRITMIIMMSALPINIALNYLLVFGNFGFPRLGGVGAGYASAITYWCIALAGLLVVYRLKPFRAYNVLGRFHPVSVPALKEQLKIGLPVGFAIFFETSIFGVVALFMAQYGTVTIAAHQAAISFASLVYMVPLSIGLALTIIVGFEVGARRYHDAQQYSKLGIGIAVMMAIGCAIGLFIFNKMVAGLYTKEPEVLMLIQQFLIYAAFFQLSDAIAAPIQGILRGYKDVNVTFVVALISYWVIGLPLGFLLAKYSWLGAFGYWVGLITGLAIGAIALTARLMRVQKKVIKTSQGG